MTLKTNTWYNKHLPPAQVSNLESFFQQCPQDTHISQANARITESPKLSKSHFPQFHYLPFKNTQPDHKNSDASPCPARRMQQLMPTKFHPGGDEYPRLGILLSFNTTLQSFAAFMSQGSISHLGELFRDFPPGAGSKDHGMHQARKSPFPYSQCQLKPVPNTPAGTNSQNWAQREFWPSSLAASQLQDLGATFPLLS